MKDTLWTAAHTAPAPRQKSSFLNLVAVAATVGVLALLAMGSMRFASAATALNRATLSISKLREAFGGFKDKYTKLPITAPDEKEYLETKGPFLNTLLGLDAANNPENIVFLDQPAALLPSEHVLQNAQGEWEVRDPWGNLFRIQIDLNEDGKIPNPFRGGGPPVISVLPPGLAIYSAGPDGNFDTWQDNLRNW